MPQLADITVKKNDGTTNITYTGLQPSSGDGVAAVWRQTTPATQACQPELRLVAKAAKNKSGRAVRGTFVYPQAVTNSATGITSVFTSAYGDFNFTFDKSMSQVELNEAAAQFGGLVSSALIKSAMQAGFSVT